MKKSGSINKCGSASKFYNFVLFIMNKPKNVNGWILCPSKSYPGKFYYFNVTNGEAAWCLTEAEKATLNKETGINKVLDKGHSYPEPNTPPAEELGVTNNFCDYNSQPPIPLNQLQTPHTFGRPVFPKYIPHEYMQGYVWPIQPMFVANKPEKKNLLDQVTQTVDHEPDVVIQSCSIPLTKRFGTYSQVSLHNKPFGNISTEPSTVNWWNTNQAKNNFGTFQGIVFGPKVNKNNLSNSNTDENQFKPIFNYQNTKLNNNIIKEPVLKPFCRNNTITDNTYSCDINFMNQFGQNSTLNTENKVENSFFNKHKVITTTDNYFKKPVVQCLAANNSWANSSKNNKKNTVASQKITLSQGNTVQTRSNNTADIQDNIQNFNFTDLRLVLEAKRRKLHNNDGRIGQVDETPKQVINELNIRESAPSRVTFDDTNLKEDTMSDDIMEDCSNSDKMSSSTILDISYLKSISKPYLKTDPWYIVIDMGVLLDHFSFIDEFVKEDITCRVLVPNAVRSYIQTISVGEYAGRSRVMAARKAIRQLAAPGQHVILQPPIMESRLSSAIDGIIECCQQVYQQHHVILVTTDKELFNKATVTGIQTYKINDIKNSMATKKAVSFDIQKINITNDNKELFMPKTKNYEPFDFSNTVHLAADDSNIFKVPAAVKRNKEPLKKYNQVETGTSPIIFDNMDTKGIGLCLNNSIIDLTNEQNAKSESNIEENIKNLSLFEKAVGKNLNSEVKSTKNRKFSGLKLKRVANLNCTVQSESKDKLSQNSSMEPTKRVFRKVVLNRNNHLKNNTVENLTIHRTIQNNTGQSISNDKSQITDSVAKQQNINVNVKTQSIKTNVDTQTKNDIEMPKSYLLSDTQAKNAFITAMVKQNTLVENSFKTDKMQRFVDKDAEERFRSHFEEWMCCFAQIMEDCLSDILMDNLTNKRHTLTAPWTLQEAVVTIKELYLNKADIKSVAEKMFNVISSASDQKGRLPKTMNSDDFMKLFGLGVRLLESLQLVLPSAMELRTSMQLLHNLLDCIQDPSRDMEILPNHTPVWPTYIDDDSNSLNRNVSLKKPSDIIEYLRKHYPSWKDYQEEKTSVEQTNIQVKEVHQTQKPIVIKTFGKNLNNIIINKTKGITFENVLEESQLKVNINSNKEKDPNATESESKQNRKNLNNNNYMEKYLNKNPTNLNNGMEKPSKIIRNVNLIDNFDARIRNKSNLKENFGLGALDFKTGYTLDNEFHAHKSNSFPNDAQTLEDDGNVASNETIENYANAATFYDKQPATEINDSSISLNDKHTRINDNDDIDFNDDINFNDDTDDSGFENEGLHAYSFIKTFLTELIGSFKLIYDFIDNSIQEFRCDVIDEDSKKQLYDRANETHLHVADIIGKLKTIIEREAAEKTKLKSLIVKAGLEALTDKRITRYRQVVKKCLEQAQLLESALKTILALTNKHSDISLLDVDQTTSNINYFNIYE